MADLLDAVPLDAPPALDPWAEERKARPDRPLLRVIDLVKDRQQFHELAGDTDQILDGATIIVRQPGAPELSELERDAIVREYDDVWRAQR